QPPHATETGLLNYYLLDAASVLAVEALAIQPGERVGDLCAAPGGKSLLCALKLDGRGQLIANDRSSNRRLRISRILESYLPPAQQAIVTVTGHDAMTWSQHQVNYFDKVLLDAPCSSERHVLEDARALADWAPGRSKSLAIQQFAMLASALEIVKVGGRIVYSTCALSHLENDEIIRKLHKNVQVGLSCIDQRLALASRPSTAGRCCLIRAAGGHFIWRSSNAHKAHHHAHGDVRRIDSHFFHCYNAKQGVHSHWDRRSPFLFDSMHSRSRKYRLRT
ncbi:MAG: hypothetical protein FJ040_12805, partial [Chloroflexi bacterium]|nr:hypothetical protein [Chloroflexota bacterium]